MISESFYDKAANTTTNGLVSPADDVNETETLSLEVAADSSERVRARLKALKSSSPGAEMKQSPGLRPEILAALEGSRLSKLKSTVPKKSLVESPFVGEPVPLPKNSVDAPTFDDDLIPSVWSPWILDIAERLQCPPDYAAVTAVVGASSLVGNGIRVRPKVRDPWLVVPNLWGAIVGPPGIMKSPSVNEGLLFLKEIAEEERRKYEIVLKKVKFEQEFNKAKQEEIKKKLKKASAEAKEQLRVEYATYETEEPREKRLWTSDTTVEKLGELLNENPNSMLVTRDELTGWFRTLDRPGHEQDRAFYLEGWSGENSFTFDRIGRGKTYIKHTTISIIGTIQPAMIIPYLKGSIDGQSDDGFVQRFQLLVYPESPKTFRYVDREPAGRAHVRNSFAKLYSATPEEIGAKRSTEDGGHAYVQFDPEAQEFFQEWLTRLENDLRNGTFELPAFESHLAKYRSLMPSLALIFFLLEKVTGKQLSSAIGLKHAELAAKWCNYLKGHAWKLYSIASGSDFDVAGKILEKIKSGAVKEEFTARDIYSNHWGGLKKAQDVQRGLDLLAEYNWLLAVPRVTGGRGSTSYLVHPRLYQESTKSEI